MPVDKKKKAAQPSERSAKPATGVAGGGKSSTLAEKGETALEEVRLTGSDDEQSDTESEREANTQTAAADRAAAARTRERERRLSHNGAPHREMTLYKGTVGGRVECEDTGVPRQAR